MNAYGADMDEAGRYADVFFETVRLGQTTLPELAESLSSVTSIAAAACVPIETVAASIATLTARGMPTAEAMTALRGAISAIISPSSEAAKMAESLGIEFSASALESKGLETILQDVYTTTGGNVEQIAALFGNVRGLTGVLAAFGSDGGEHFIKTQEVMQNSAGSTAQAFEKMADDIKNINQTLVNNFQNTLGEIGDRVLGEYGELVTGITEVFQAIQQAVKDGSFDDIFDAINDVAGDLTDTFKAMAKNLPEALEGVDFSEFSSAIERLAGETGNLIKAMFGGADLTTADGLQQAIQRIVNIMKTLTEVTEGIVKGWQPWVKALSDYTDKAASGSTETNNMVGELLQLGKVVNTLSGFFGGAGEALSAFGNLLNVIAAQRLVKLVSGLTGATGALSGLGTAATAAAGTAAGKAGLFGLAAAAGWTVGTLINDYVPSVGKAAQSLFGWADGLVDFSGKQEAAGKEAEAFGKLVDSIASNITDFDYDLGGLRKTLEGLGHDLSGLSDAEVIRLAAEVNVLSFEEAMQIVRTKVPEECYVSRYLNLKS
jgi:uncharacterized protein YukE